MNIRTRLIDLAAQENCDGEPYDTMMIAADMIFEWRPISTAPYWVNVLVSDGASIWVSSQKQERHHAGDGMPLYGQSWHIGTHKQPTHWMPLPDLPSA